jgi:hypothetical protein
MNFGQGMFTGHPKMDEKNGVSRYVSRYVGVCDKTVCLRVCLERWPAFIVVSEHLVAQGTEGGEREREEEKERERGGHASQPLQKFDDRRLHLRTALVPLTKQTAENRSCAPSLHPSAASLSNVLLQRRSRAGPPPEAPLRPRDPHDRFGIPLHAGAGPRWVRAAPTLPTHPMHRHEEFPGVGRFVWDCGTDAWLMTGSCGAPSTRGCERFFDTGAWDRCAGRLVRRAVIQMNRVTREGGGREGGREGRRTH